MVSTQFMMSKFDFENFLIAEPFDFAFILQYFLKFSFLKRFFG